MTYIVTKRSELQQEAESALLIRRKRATTRERLRNSGGEVKCT